MDRKKEPSPHHPVVSQVSNRGRNFILQVADLMIQRVINGLIILMLNMASSNYTDLLSVKVWTPPPTQPSPTQYHSAFQSRPVLEVGAGGASQEEDDQEEEKV